MQYSSVPFLSCTDTEDDEDGSDGHIRQMLAENLAKYTR